MLNIVIDRQSMRATAQIALFKDRATSVSGMSDLGLVKTFSFSFTMRELADSANVMAYAYTKIAAAANTMVSKDLQGHSLEEPIPFDSDISGGENA